MNSQQQDHLRQTTTTLQIIVGALVMGVLTFAGVVVFVIRPDGNAEEEATLLAPMAAGAALLALVAAVLVPRLMQSNFRRTIAAGQSLPNMPAAANADLGDVGSLAAAYQTTLIVGAAVLEGAAFFNLTSYMIEHQMISLLCAALMVIGLFFKFPTRSGLENWVADEAKQIEELRSLEA